MKNWNKMRATLYLCMMLMMAMVLCTTGCSDKKDNAETTTENIVTTEDVVEVATNNEEKNVLGEGAVIFDFSVVDKDGVETVFEIHTDKETVGEALVELGVIVGEESTYGLYVKKVNGILADYETDGTYWAFYINGEYAMSGVDTTAITEGDSYMFKVEK